MLELLASTLLAGVPVSTALRRVSPVLEDDLAEHVLLVVSRLELGAEMRQAWAGTPVALLPLSRVMQLVHRTGMPAQALLRQTAADLRARQVSDVEVACARLGIRMVLPLGLCALPAFFAVSVVPVVLSMLANWS